MVTIAEQDTNQLCYTHAEGFRKEIYISSVLKTARIPDRDSELYQMQLNLLSITSVPMNQGPVTK